MTAQELTTIDLWLDTAQKALSGSEPAPKFDGVRRLIIALRNEIAVLRDTASTESAVGEQSATPPEPDVLLDVCHAVERAMDAIRTSRSYHTTIATKLYASLTAVRAQVTWLRSAHCDRLAGVSQSNHGIDVPLAAANTRSAPPQLSFTGVPNLAPHGWRDMRKADHFVTIYDSEAALLRSASEFVADGLWRSERVIVISTEAHRQELELRLRSNGVDVVSAAVRRKYLSRDADDLLDRVMEAEAPNRNTFEQVLGGLTGAGGWPRVETRIFTEMATRLWQRGDRAGALKLEQWWSDFGVRRGVTVFCGYPTTCFTPADEAGALADLCRLHARVVPPEHHAVAPRPVGTRQRI